MPTAEVQSICAAILSKAFSAQYITIIELFLTFSRLGSLVATQSTYGGEKSVMRVLDTKFYTFDDGSKLES